MSYIEKATEDCLKELIKQLRIVKTSNGNNEYRIAIKKSGALRIPLMKLYQIAFEQGVYTNQKFNVSYNEINKLKEDLKK